MKSRKRNINTVLKVAIVQTGRKQRQIAMKARIGEVRLSAIIHGHLQATDKEQDRISRAVNRDKADLFPTPETAAVA